MRRRQTKALRLAVVLLALLVGAGGAYGAYRYLLNRKIAQWRQDGLAAARAGNFDLAATLLGQYIQRHPRDVEALSAYVSARESTELPDGQQYALTVAALRILVGLDPDRLDDRHHLLELYLKLDARPEAIDTANAILARHHDDVPRLGIETEILQRQHKDHEALLLAAKWAAAAPADLKPQMTACALRARLGQPSSAIIADAAKLRDAHPQDPAFELLLGYAYVQAGDEEHAAQWLKSAAAHPELGDELVQILVAQFDGLGLPQDSLGVLEQHVKNGGGPELRYALAQRLWQLGKWDQVAPLLADLNLSDPKTDATLIAFRAIASANLSRKDDLALCRDTLSGRRQAAARAWTLLLRQIVTATEIDEKQAAQECRNALSIDPQNPYLRYYLGDAEARLGETDLAIAAWRLATAYDTSWSTPPVRLVDALLQKGRPDQAMEVAAFVVRRNPNNAAVVISLARAWAADLEAGGIGRADDLLKLVDEVQKQLPQEEHTLLIRLQQMARGGDKARAAAEARAAIGRTPAHSEDFLFRLAALSLHYSLGLEEECYRRSQQVYGLTPGLAYSRAIGDAVSGHAADGLSLFDSLAAASGNAGAVEWRLARAHYLDINAMPGAAAALTALSDGYPGNRDVQRVAVSSQALRGDAAVLNRAIDRLHYLTDEKDYDWRLARARMLVMASGSEQDIQRGSLLLDALIKEFPQFPEPHILQARALVAMKRLDGAVAHLTVASQLDPTSVPIALQLAAILQSRGDFERVRQQIDRILPQVHSPEQLRDMASMLADGGNPADAIDLMATTQPTRRTQSAEAGELQARQNDLLLAMLYRRQHQPQKAEEIIQRLLEHPDVASVQLAASFYVSQGRMDRAEATLSLLDGMKLEPGIRQLLLGSYHAELGEIPAAADHYKLATQDAPGNPVAWRVLAVCQMAMGQVDQAIHTLGRADALLPRDEALAVLKQQSGLLHAGEDLELRPLVIGFIRNPLGDKTDQELLSLLAETRNSTDLPMLVGRLQQLAERHPESAGVQLQLARSYWAMGRQAAALDTVRHAVSAFGGDAAPAEQAVRLAAAAGQWSDMASAAEIWKKRSADPQAPDIAMAQAQIGLGQPDAALVVLESYLPAATRAPDHFADLLATDAQALLTLGRQPEAVALLQPLAGTPAGRIRWLQLTRACRGKADALAWLATLAPRIPSDDLPAQIGLAEINDQLGRRFNDPQLSSKALADLKRLAAAPDANSVAMTAAGAQCERAGDPAAESFYRRAIALDAGNWVARNNLAMLLLDRGGDARAACALAAEAVKLQPRRAVVRDTLATAQAKAADFKSAASSMDTAVHLDPDNACWRIRLAQYLMDGSDVIAAARAVGDLDDARLDLQSCPVSVREQLRVIRKHLSAVARG